MKNWLTVSVVVVGCSAIFVILPMTQKVMAGVAEKVSQARDTLQDRCATPQQQRKAIKVLGDANDCEMDCDCSKTVATKELVRLADGDCDVAKAARKELGKDLNRKESSVTRQRVSQVIQDKKN